MPAHMAASRMHNGAQVELTSHCNARSSLDRPWGPKQWHVTLPDEYSSAHLLAQQVQVCLRLFRVVCGREVLRHAGACVGEQCLCHKADGCHRPLNVQHHCLGLHSRRPAQPCLLADWAAVCMTIPH